MPGPRLDGAGTAKMETLEEALQVIQRLHAIVERMGVAVKSQQDTRSYRSQLQRAGSPLVGLLKGQFALIADQLSTFLLISSRGGGEQARLRALREGVAQIRMQLDIAVEKVRQRHAVEE